MVNANSRQFHMEPSPEFNDACINAIREYLRGAVPFRETINKIESLRDHAIAENHLPNQARSEHALGYLQHYRGNLNTSIQHYEQARTLFKKVNNPTRMATMDLNQGENYRFKGDFNRALQLYRSAYQTAKDLSAVRTQTIAALNEGLVLITLEQNTSAMQTFHHVEDLLQQWDREDSSLPGFLCELHHGKAVVYLRQNQLEEAWHSAQRALEIADATGEPHQRGYANRTMGEVLCQLGRTMDDDHPDDPDDYFRASGTAFREINAEAELARTMYAQALSQARRGRRTMAARKLQYVMIMFTKLGMVDDAARAAEAQLAVL